jgi:uncharacterized protein (TIGR00290 family)
MVELKQAGVTGLVSGDLDFGPHREWIERACGFAGIEPWLPLWGVKPVDLLDGFVGAGFRAVVVAVKSEVMGEKWLGRTLDRSALSELQELATRHGIHLCGENGEYHTFVIAGPLFQRPLTIIPRGKLHRDGRWFLEVERCDLG